MRRLLFLTFFSLTVFASRAQFGNEWIRHQQPYVKIPVAATGAYRITKEKLLNAGFPANTTDPRNLQLFHRGRECAILVTGEGDGSFDDDDFVLFFGQQNDGTNDTQLYAQPQHQPHTYLNLFSDTTAYFLTADPAAQGRRMDVSQTTNGGALTPEAFYYAEVIRTLRDNYSQGLSELGGLLSSTVFGPGEGWTGLRINNGQFRDYNLAGLTFGATGAGVPELEIMLSGRGEQPHLADIEVGATASSLRLIGNASFPGWQVHKASFPLQWSDIGADGSIVVRVRSQGAAESYDPCSVTYLKIRFPRDIASAGGVLHLRENPGGQSLLQIPGAGNGHYLMDVTDPASVVYFQHPAEAVVESTTTPRTMWLSASLIEATVKPVSFTPIDPGAYDYIIISHSLLMKPAGGYGDPVRAFADYRASEAGGSFSPLVVDVHQLYDQFNHGEISSAAIRKFMAYLIQQNVPRYLFIIGNGLDTGYDYFRKPQQFQAHPNLVPAAGYPASDHFFTFDLVSPNMPAVPTGRITARTPAHVAAYLDKVRETESTPYAGLWRKNILHLTGGIRAGEPQRFSDYAEGFGRVAKGRYLGGRVKAIAKQSTNPVEFINIKDEVNNGLNLVTFFGHSASTVIDFDIGFVTDPRLEYDNKGKYPVFLINGCNAGAFFLNQTLFGEDWINADEKGAIGFIAHTSYGLESTLKGYSDIFYEVAYGDSSFIKRGIGDIQQEVIRRYWQKFPTLLHHLTQVQQMFLLGDPAVKLFGAPAPDYALDAAKVFVESLDDQPLTAQSDSFAIRMVVTNYGLATGDTLRVRVTRTLPDQTAVAYDTLFAPVLYQDTLSFIVRGNNPSGGGSNLFAIELDPEEEIAETNEDNNQVSVPFLIALNRTKNLYPRDFSIVPDRDVRLQFQTTDLLSGPRAFELEIDTVYTFDSPYRSSHTVEATVLARHDIALEARDSLVYYWRTRFADPLPEESAEWEVSSFMYIADGPEGWVQGAFPQYLKNTGVGLVRDEPVQLLRFEETVTSIAIVNHGAAVPEAGNLDVSVRLDGAEFQINTQLKACRLNTINLIAFDRTTTFPYAPVPIKFQDFRTCGRQPQVINSFRVNEFFGTDPDTGLPAGMIEAIDNIQQGDSVVFFTIENAGFSTWPQVVKEKLGEVGISLAQLASFQDGEPLVIFGKKGAAAGTAVVHRTEGTPANAQTLTVDETVTGRYSSGSMRSTLIGPAAEWHELVLNLDQVEPQDVASVTVLGVKTDGSEVVVMDNVVSGVDLSAIDPGVFPYLRLVYRTADELNLTAVQLNHWMVLYDGVAEGLLLYSGERGTIPLAEGEPWVGEYGFANISQKTFSDSLHVDFAVFNVARGQWERHAARISAPAPGDTTFFNYHVQTEEKTGLNDVTVEVNPRLVPEQHYDNNLLRQPGLLDVQGDVFDPVVEVTVDGRVLRNGDFVSQHPEITLRLWDESRHLLKTDTLGVRIFLQRPCAQAPCPLDPVYFSDEAVSWLPASATNDFSVVYLPGPLEAGTYLLSVSASDSRGNQSGDEPYEISFEVTDEQNQVLLAPYPNPGNGAFTFTLVLSGQETPDAFTLSIYGVDGRLVKTISHDGELFIGTNEIRWDGRSDAGVLMPSGLYLYRIQVMKDGRPLPLRIPARAAHLQGDYGKIAIFR